MWFARCALALSVALTLLTGCSTGKGAGSTPTPTPSDNGVAALVVNEILDRALQALRAAGSFRMKGAMTNDDTELELDLKFRGEDVTGTVVIDGAGLEMTKLGDTVYVKPDEAALKRISKSKESVANFFRGKWLKGSAKGPNLSAFADVADLEQILQPTGALSKGGLRDINGTQAIGLVDTSINGGTLYIATVGPPYLLRIEDDTRQGVIDFTEFGATFKITAPPANEVLDVDAQQVPA